mmetsp:Transcript_11268/g.33384  ORF Transcript_11268/g.33384 Transcript_11268/m.33384 type:complete len:389 (-) Transcript_11268:102-1268(-)
MIYYNYNENWFALIFGSTDLLRKIFLDVLVAGLVGIIAYAVESQAFELADIVGPIGVNGGADLFGSGNFLDDRVHIIIITPLSFLLIFRSNHAYARYWDGRKELGAMLRGLREFTRMVAGYHAGPGPKGVAARAELRRQALVTFEVGSMTLTRREKGDKGRSSALTALEVEERVPSANPKEVMALVAAGESGCVLLAAHWVSRSLSRAGTDGHVHMMLMRDFEAGLSTLLQGWHGASAIGSTPLPFPYVQMLHALLAAFIYTLPFTLARKFGWLTPVMAMLVAFSLLGINSVARELEMPFGNDANDLPVRRFNCLAASTTWVMLHDRDPETPETGGDRHARTEAKAPDEVSGVKVALPATGIESEAAPSSSFRSVWRSFGRGSTVVFK